MVLSEGRQVSIRLLAFKSRLSCARAIEYLLSRANIVQVNTQTNFNIESGSPGHAVKGGRVAEVRFKLPLD
jgi:hypothetical protein